MSTVSLPGDVRTCRPFRRPNTSLLSSALLLSWRVAVSRPSHSPSALMGPPVHGPSKRLQGRVCLGAWGGREGRNGAGPQLGFAQLGVAQEGGRVERRCVWGADWAAVVSPSPRDEASAKQVLPWRDRHGPLKRFVCTKTSLGSPVCEWVVPWLCCAAPPAARDRRQCTLQTKILYFISIESLTGLVRVDIGPFTFMPVCIGIAHRLKSASTPVPSLPKRA
jgi:hypothetical protein